MLLCLWKQEVIQHSRSMAIMDMIGASQACAVNELISVPQQVCTHSFAATCGSSCSRATESTCCSRSQNETALYGDVASALQAPVDADLAEQETLPPSKLTVPQLKAELKTFNMSTAGKKAELVHRLQTALAAAKATGHASQVSMSRSFYRQSATHICGNLTSVSLNHWQRKQA